MFKLNEVNVLAFGVGLALALAWSNSKMLDLFTKALEERDDAKHDR
jgi:hypothetical protein